MSWNNKKIDDYKNVFEDAPVKPSSKHKPHEKKNPPSPPPISDDSRKIARPAQEKSLAKAKKNKILCIIFTTTIIGTIILIIILRLILGRLYSEQSTNSSESAAIPLPATTQTPKPPIKKVLPTEFEEKYKALKKKLTQLKRNSKGADASVIKKNLKEAIKLLEAFLKENDTDKYRNLPHYKKAQELLETQKMNLSMY